MTFYNTINLVSPELIEAIRANKKQEDRVLSIFKIVREPMTPFQVQETYKAIFRDVPITSIRRAMTDLCNQNKLEKTAIQKKGKYHRNNHLWRLPKKRNLFSSIHEIE